MVIDVAASSSHLRLAEGLDRGYTLPAEWYTSAEVFEQEKTRIFRRSWQYVGHTGQALKPGDFFTASACDVPIVILRDSDGVLRAFANVCRHRGSELVLEKSGCRKTIQCHYHGWTWNLDGTLRTAPRWNEQPEFNKDEFPLFALQLETWGPLIFVNTDAQAGPLSDILQELPGLVADTGLDFSKLRFRERRHYDLAANWKVVVENYNECYHCPIAHPSFCDLIDVENYKVITTHEYFALHHGPVTEAAKNGAENGFYKVSEAVLNAGAKEGLFAFIWPTIMLDINPGPHNLLIGSVLPIDANHSLQIYDTFVTDEVDDATVQGMVDFGDQVQQEDMVLCESVQRGLRSGFYTQGKLMITRENGIQFFQKLVYRALTK